MDILDNNETCDFAKYFKNLGYDYSWDFSKRDGMRWYELYKNGELFLQVEMVPLQDIIKDFCTIEETKPTFWIGCDSDEKYNEVLKSVREFELQNQTTK